MQPFITAMPSLLLLACFIGVATSTRGVNANQILHNAGLFKTTEADAGVSLREVINMTLFTWMYNETKNASHLTICADSLLLPGEQTKTNPTLVYNFYDGNQTNIEGTVLGGNESCSLFTQTGKVPLAKSVTQYRLSLIVTNDENTTIIRSGDVIFGMPVEISTLLCYDKQYTRVSGLTSNQTLGLGYPCIYGELNLSDDVVCYIEGEFSSNNLCYTPNETDLQVCLQGSGLTTAVEVDGQPSIGYLAYKGATKPARAHLSLEFDGHELVNESIEALIWKQNTCFATSCSKTNCPIPDFSQELVRYNVCVVTLIEGLAVTTSTSNITDLNARAFTYNGSALLQFQYSNSNDEGNYIAYTENNADKNVSVDCSAVPTDRICHGYFEETCSGDVHYVAVEYADAQMGPKGNKILFPCPS